MWNFDEKYIDREAQIKRENSSCSTDFKNVLNMV